MNAPLKAALLAIALAPFALSPCLADPAKQAFDPESWSVRCWNGETRRWEDLGLGKMTLTEAAGATRITNTSGIHRHAHLVYPAVPEGDFTFTLELRGGYELGYLNADGKDEMLYCELAEKDGADGAPREEQFRTYELSREGTRFAIRREGRPLPLVHFQFDYGEDFVITLAIQDGESAEIRSVSMRQGT